MQIRPQAFPAEGATLKEGARAVGYRVGWLKRYVGAGVALRAVGTSLNAREGRPLAGAGALRSSLDGRWLGL